MKFDCNCLLDIGIIYRLTAPLLYELFLLCDGNDVAIVCWQWQCVVTIVFKFVQIDLKTSVLIDVLK